MPNALGGKPSGVSPSLRIRMYIDGEQNASVDYPLFLAHGAGPAQTQLSPLEPWSSALFGRTHDSGWFNHFLVPFQKSIRISLTDPQSASHFWYMCRGLENAPLVFSGLTFPPNTRLATQRTTNASVTPGTLVSFADVSGTHGIVRQINLVVNSSNYGYQEGCVSALIDGENAIWISSGLEGWWIS